MKLPQIAERLRQLSKELDCPELATLAAEMRRRSPVRRVAPRSAPATPGLREDIRSFAKDHPDMSMAEIGAVFNVNNGRVSEALAGFRA